MLMRLFFIDLSLSQISFLLCTALIMSMAVVSCSPKVTDNATPAKEQRVQFSAVGFYNLENLFHPSDEEGKNDEEFTPEGRNKYTYERYQTKLTNLSEVLSELAIERCPEGLAVIGVSEIENRQVLQDLVQQPALRKRNYQIVQYEGPDRRGVDVGLLYNPRFFVYEKSEPITLDIVKDGDTTFTRDILHVTGRLNGERTHILVNHWPSRSGGEKVSMYKRAAAARACRELFDRLRAEDPDVKLIIGGDLNDNPTSPSVDEVLMAQGEVDKDEKLLLFNPMYPLYKQGQGSNAWRDSWSLFDQIILSPAYLRCGEDQHCFHSAHVYNEKYLKQSEGRFKGYPFRTYVGSNFLGGYSDHFPVYTYLAKRID